MRARFSRGMPMPMPRSEERRAGKEGRSLCDWSSDVCSSDLGAAMARQEDREGGALAGLAVDEDEAAGLLDDAVDGGEAEAGAGADFLGREERLEDAREILARDADADAEIGRASCRERGEITV